MLTGSLKERFLRARRGLIARDFSALNDMQLRAVMAPLG